jgi:hypothetical protein
MIQRFDRARRGGASKSSSIGIGRAKMFVLGNLRDVREIFQSCDGTTGILVLTADSIYGCGPTEFIRTEILAILCACQTAY